MFIFFEFNLYFVGNFKFLIEFLFEKSIKILLKMILGIIL